MTQTKPKMNTTAGLAGLLAIACIPCCVPLIAPVLAYLGIASIGTATLGWYVAAAAAVGLALTFMLFKRRRRNACQQPDQAVGTCECAGSCRT